MTLGWKYLTIIIALRYAILSNDIFLSCLISTIFNALVLSHFFTDGSIILIKEIKPIILNLTSSFFLAALGVYFNIYAEVLDTLHYFIIKFSDYEWFNILLTYLVVRALFKFSFQLKSKYTRSIMACFLLITSNVHANDYTLIKKSLEADILPDTLFVDGQTHSFQVKGYPFFCDVMSMSQAQTYIKITRTEQGISLYMSLLSNDNLPVVCEKLILDNISKLSKDSIVLDHNLESYKSSKSPLYISVYYKKEGFDEAQYRDLFSHQINSINHYKGMSCGFLLLFILIYLYEIRFKTIKEFYYGKK